MSRLDINHAGPDRSFSPIRSFILSQLGINHDEPDKEFRAIRTLELTS